MTDSALEKVNDVKLEQSFLGRLFGYGDIEILTGSELGVNRFTRIGNPVKFKQAMLNAKQKLEHDGEGVSRSSGAESQRLIKHLDELHSAGLLDKKEYDEKRAALVK